MNGEMYWERSEDIQVLPSADRGDVRAEQIGMELTEASFG